MQFTKMHGTGNDFVLVDGREFSDQDWSQVAERVCDRHFGIGADGLIMLQPSDVADLRMRMWNPDGSEAEMCGNGIRCFTKLALEDGIVTRSREEFTAETGAGILTLRPRWEDGHITSVQVDMGAPILEPEMVPVAVTAGQLEPDANGLRWAHNYAIEVEGRRLDVSCVSMGNPHAIHFIDQLPKEFPLEHLGPLVEHHSFFPRRVNFHAVQVLDRSHLRMRTWERGAGLTLACGTGACATAVAAHLLGYTDDTVEIEVPGGMLTIHWPGQGPVLMTGPAESVFSGQWTAGE